MKIIAYDPYIKKSKAEALNVSLYDSLDDLLKTADVITIHTPLTVTTKNMITAEKLALVKDNVILVNCARGGIVNENDLYDCMVSGKIFAAGVDVFVEEPPKNTKFLSLENVFVTPHIGANTAEGQKAVSAIIAEQVLNALHERPYQHGINIPFMVSLLPDHLQLYFKVAEKIGKLAGQISKGRPEKISVIMVGKNFEEDLTERKFDVPFSYQPFTIAGINGFLKVSMQGAVTYINAPYLAKDRNIIVEESKTEHFDKFNDLIIFKLKTDVEEITIGGTVFPDKLGRIVFLDRFHLDMVPEGTFLAFRIIDRPGVIGTVGTILGNHGINIASFSLSRVVSGEEVAFISVDCPIGPDVLTEIRAINGMIEAIEIQL